MTQQRVPFKEGGKPLPFQVLRPMAASVAPARGQFMMQNGSGYALIASATVPNLTALGPADRDEDAGANDGDAKILTWCTFVSQYANSTISGDAILDSDMGVVAWAAGPGTIGKLSNSSGNRSMLGLAYGLDFEAGNRTPLVWSGPVAHSVAKGVHVADNALLGAHTYAVDGGDGTDFTEAIFSQPRAKLHGRITAIEFIANATLAASGGTNYKTLTVTKYDSTGANGVVVGTMTTVLVTTKWVAKAFTLSGTSANLDVLEGDIFTIQNSHAGSGATTPAGVLRVVGKVQ